MSQITPEEMQRRGALLKKAKQILLQEYAAIRTQQHQQWIRDSETSWRTNGVLMAYPPGKIYPGEQEIIEKALELYNKSIIPKNSPVQTETTISEAPIVNEASSNIEPANVIEQLQEIFEKSVGVPIDNRLIVEPVSNYIETLMQPITGQTLPVIVPDIEPVIEEVIDEPITETVIEEPTATETIPKHSLLRSVLSGWLSKNKDKET
jgi:hypothetical protein